MSTRAGHMEHGGSVSGDRHLVSWKPGERVCSLEELYRAANIRPSRKMPIEKYYKDLDETLEKAKTRLMEQDLQYAYVFYLRYVTVVLKHLPVHPDYNKPEYTKNKEKVSNSAKKALTMLERLQPVLKQRHEEYVKYLESIPRPKASVSTYSTRRGSSVKRLPTIGLESINGDGNSVDNNNGSQLQNEQHGTDHGQSLNTDAKHKQSSPMHEFSLAQTLQGLNMGHGSASGYRHQQSASVGSHASYSGSRQDTPVEYPTVITSTANWPHVVSQESHSAPGSASVTAPRPKPLPIPPAARSETPPQMPPRNRVPVSPHPTPSPSPGFPSHTHQQRPTLPPKPQEYHDGTDRPEEQDITSTTVGDPAKSFMPPCLINSAHYSLTEGGVRMRPIQMPEGIFEEFIDIASQNTSANLETCGVLCGKQVPGQEALIMTTLIIPKQSATSDTCTTEHEEELFVEQMDRDLITLGWIHTHPSQTCFMSSLDLHTQCSYQLMLPEAIAIVCAPKHDPRFGIFRLTDPTGIDLIQNCKEKSTFHPHDQSKTIYKDADTDGHVIFVNYDFDIIDIRGSI
ncbi:hypothetical protein FB645_003401 [Coemansia sp. IMI 203386]|nr:hypothetical protein FB645_003401 [Coemansia sp. IMI 203386]